MPPEYQPGQAAPSLQQILAEDEAPSTFGSLFRFIGRPGYMVRNLLMGDFEGFGRNMVQLFNELAFGGFLNQNLTISNMLGFDRDLTNVQQRPEFTNVLQKWGVDTTAWPTMGKLAADIAGGLVTDPLMLIGGGEAKSAGLAAKLAKGGPAADQALVHAIQTVGGPILQGRFAKGVAQAAETAIPRLVPESYQVRGVLGEAARAIGPSPWAPAIRAGTEAAQRAAPSAIAQNVKEGVQGLLRTRASNLPSLITDAGAVEGGIKVGRRAAVTPERAAAIVRGVQGRVAKGMFFDGAALEDAGINLSRGGLGMPTPATPEGIRNWFAGVHAPGEFTGFLNGTRKFALVPEEALQVAPPAIRDGLLPSVGNYERAIVQTGGAPFALLWKRADQSLAQRVQLLFQQAQGFNETDTLSGIFRDAFRTAGFHDSWIAEFLRSRALNPNVMDDLGKWNRFLLQTPSDVLDEGMKNLVKQGMAPSSGIAIKVPGVLGGEGAAQALGALTGWRSWGQHLYMPWSSVGTATVPGMLMKLDRTYHDGKFANFFGDLATRWWDRSVRAMFDRFKAVVPGSGDKLPQVAGELVRSRNYEKQGAIQKVMNDVLRFVTEPFQDAREQEILAGDKLQAEELYHVGRNALTRQSEEWRALIERGPRAALERGVLGPDTHEGVAGLALTRTIGHGAVLNMPEQRAVLRNLIPLSEATNEAARTMPTNPAMNMATLQRILEGGAGSKNPVLRRAAKAARKALIGLENWQGEFDRIVQRAHARRGALNDLTARLTEMISTQEEIRNAVGSGQQIGEAIARARTLRDALSHHAETAQAIRNALHNGAPAEFVQGLVNEHVLAGDALTAADRSLAETLREMEDAATGAGLPLTSEEAAGGLPQWVHDYTARSQAIQEGADAADRLRQEILNAPPMEFFTRDAELGKVYMAARENLLAGEIMNHTIEQSTAKIAVLRGLTTPEEIGALRRQVSDAHAFVNRSMEEIPAFMRFRAKNVQALMRNSADLPAYWQFVRSNPFYFPHQADTRLWELLHDESLPAVRRQQIMSVFEDARNHPTISQFTERLRNLADEFGLDYGGEADSLVDKRFDALAYKRLVAFEHVKYRQLAYQDVRRVAETYGGRWDSYTRWLQGVLSPTGPRQNTVLKLLGGGTFDFTYREGSSERALAWWNKTMDNPRFMRIVRVDGQKMLRVNWAGLNYLYKPMLTSVPWNLRYHVRNIIAMPFMAAFHPELGFGSGSITQARKAIMNHGIVKWATKHFKDWGDLASPEIGATESALAAMPAGERIDSAIPWLVRATLGKGSEREAAREVLYRLNDRVGNYTWREVFAGMDKFLGQPLTQADMLTGEQIEHHFVEALGGQTSTPQGAGKLVRAMKGWISWGEELASQSEVRARVHAYLHLLEKGHSVDDAITRVQQLFVEYSRQSEIERAVRDVIPFARFSIGSLAWAKPMAENPRVLQVLGTAQRSLMSDQQDEVQALPLQARESISLPLPWRDGEGNRQFITSLGLPQETTLQVLAILGLRPEVIQQRVLGATQPVVKAVGEYATGRSFFFGTDWGSYRKAPGSLAAFGLAQRVERPDGSVSYEVPGWVNEAINATPAAGSESAFSRLTDSRYGVLNKGVNFLSGVRTLSVDTEAELEKRVGEFLADRRRRGQVGSLDVYFSKLKPEDTPADVREVLSALRQERAKRRKAGALRRSP